MVLAWTGAPIQIALSTGIDACTTMTREVPEKRVYIANQLDQDKYDGCKPQADVS